MADSIPQNKTTAALVTYFLETIATPVVDAVKGKVQTKADLSMV